MGRSSTLWQFEEAMGNAEIPKLFLTRGCVRHPDMQVEPKNAKSSYYEIRPRTCPTMGDPTVATVKWFSRIDLCYVYPRTPLSNRICQTAAGLPDSCRAGATLLLSGAGLLPNCCSTTARQLLHSLVNVWIWPWPNMMGLNQPTVAWVSRRSYQKIHQITFSF